MKEHIFLEEIVGKVPNKNKVVKNLNSSDKTTHKEALAFFLKTIYTTDQETRYPHYFALRRENGWFRLDIRESFKEYTVLLSETTGEDGILDIRLFRNEKDFNYWMNPTDKQRQERDRERRKRNAQTLVKGNKFYDFVEYTGRNPLNDLTKPKELPLKGVYHLFSCNDAEKYKD